MVHCGDTYLKTNMDTIIFKIIAQTSGVCCSENVGALCSETNLRAQEVLQSATSNSCKNIRYVDSE